ncbi:GlsB/YeaQ/YmgE family stress response membrane protein, partial [Myxococcus sp. 1LA]
MKVSRASSIGLAVLVFSGQNAAWAQEPPPSEPARAPASELDAAAPDFRRRATGDAPTARDGDVPSGQEAEGATAVNEQALP